jgi:hypothetical protein
LGVTPLALRREGIAQKKVAVNKFRFGQIFNRLMKALIVGIKPLPRLGRIANKLSQSVD